MKKELLPIFILLLAITAFGQTTQSESPQAKKVAEYTELNDSEKKILGDYLIAKMSMGFCAYLPDGTGCKENNYEKQFRESLEKIVESPKLTNYLISAAAKSYEGTKLGARSAPQISQIADEQNAELLRVIVAQNQKVIELLTKIANKPK